MHNRPRKFRAMCPDGKIRTAVQTGEPSTWFAMPARVSAHGKTVSGFVTAYSDVPAPDGAEWIDTPNDGEESTGWKFSPALYLRNHDAFDRR